MERILNFDQPIDINLLDSITMAVLQGNNDERNMAQQVLTKFKEHPSSWTRVDTILEHSQSPSSQFFALQVLEDLIKTRWKILPLEQRNGIKNYVVELIIKKSSSDELLGANKLVLPRLNLALVQILKHEWPHNWKNFMPDIVSASRSNEWICQNNMDILMMLSEEIFDFSKGAMTSKKILELKNGLTDEFYLIFQLCEFVMANSQKAPLIKATLKALQRYLSWIPTAYVFKSKLVEMLCEKFFQIRPLRNVVMQCLTEIAQIDFHQEMSYFQHVFRLTMKQIYSAMPPNTDVSRAHSMGSENDRNFIQNIAIFFSAFFSKHQKEVETDQLMTLVVDAHQYMVMISTVDDIELFKLCVEFWLRLATDLFSEAPVHNSGPLMLDTPVSTPRRQVFSRVLSSVRSILIGRMAKPEEIIIVEDDNGQVIREKVPDGEAVALYKLMRRTLVYLAHLDYENTQNIMLEKLARQVDGTEWSFAKLNSLCWAIGSLADTQPESREKRFIINVIRDLLGLCEDKKGKDNKAIIASNIMYIVGQHPRFLRAHWKFLSTVVNKLFEFMHETHPGVQDMAVDTLLKITKKCKDMFAKVHPDESEPFTSYVINNLASIISDLDHQQLQTFYGCIGLMISGHMEHERAAVTDQLFQLPNRLWRDYMSQAGKDVTCLKNLETCRQLSNIIKTNNQACGAIGHTFISQMGVIYMDLLNVCKYYSEEMSKAVAELGVVATQHALFKEMRIVKREALKLITTYIGVAESPRPVLETFIPPLLPSVLSDYRNSVPQAKDPEVLALLSAIVKKCQGHVAGEIPSIFDAVFQPSLDMITSNYVDHPDIRLEFYTFLNTVVVHCYVALKQMNNEQFVLIVNSVIWGFKHTMRNIADLGLQSCKALLKSIHSDNHDTINFFYKHYFLYLMHDILVVMTDTFHKSGFDDQGEIIYQMLRVVQSGTVNQPLWNPAEVTEPNMNNQLFIRQYLVQLLRHAFPNQSKAYFTTFVTSLFQSINNSERFKSHLRDFLVELKEFSGGDENDQMFSAEKEERERNKVKEELKIPGLVPPHDPNRDNENTVMS